MYENPNAGLAFTTKNAFLTKVRICLLAGFGLTGAKSYMYVH